MSPCATHRKGRIALLEAKRDKGDPLVLNEAEEAACRVDFRLLVGARLVFADGTPDIVAYPATRHGWGRLTRLLTPATCRAKKGDCILRLDDLLDHLDDLLLIVLPESTAVAQQAHRNRSITMLPGEPPKLRIVAPPPRDVTELLALLSRKAPGRVWLGADDAPRRHATSAGSLDWRASRARRGMPLIAINDALYAAPEQRPLHDVLTCIRERHTIDEAGRRLAANAERHLKSPRRNGAAVRRLPEAIAETQRSLATASTFTLDQLCATNIRTSRCPTAGSRRPGSSIW